MKLLYLKFSIIILIISLLMHLCLGQWNSYRQKLGDDDDDDKKPFQFTDTEMTAIQTMVAFRQVIGELLEKVTIAWPALASLIMRTENPTNNRNPIGMRVPQVDVTGTKSSGFGATILKGMALSLPLLLPMAPILRRMSSSPGLPIAPFLPDPYYNSALHRRRGRSMVTAKKLKDLESVINSIEVLNRKFGRP